MSTLSSPTAAAANGNGNGSAAVTHDAPLKVGDMLLRNRAVFAPCTRNRGHVPGPAQALYYSQRAGAGLIIHEGTLPELQGYEFSNAPGIFEEEQIEGHKLVTDAVHKAGGLIVLQVMNIGRVAHPLLQGGMVNYGPSAVRAELEREFKQLSPDAAFVDYAQRKTVRGNTMRTPRALRDPWEKVASFRQAFVNAKKANYDGVEVHGANGYLVHQFLDAKSNHRTDEWGGSPEKRCKFALEVVKAAIDVFGAGRVGIKLSPSGGYNDVGMDSEQTLATYSHLLRELDALNIAYVHIQRWFHRMDPGLLGTVFEMDTWRGLYKGTLLANGDYTPEEGAAAMSRGEADAIVYGRFFMANPDLPSRIREGHPLSPVDWALAYEPDSVRGYSDYKRWEELSDKEREEARTSWAETVELHRSQRAQVPDLIARQRKEEKEREVQAEGAQQNGAH